MGGVYRGSAEGCWSALTPGKSRVTLLAIDSDGNRHRFLRGMITHDLVQRGVAFEEAYAAARAIRDQFGDRGEVTTAEIREAITGQLHKMYGDSVPSSFLGPQVTTPPLQVIYHGQEQPFSRGLLARSMQAAGVDLDRAYDLVTILELSLAADKLQVVSSAEIARRVDEFLEKEVGTRSAQRYRLLRRIRTLPRPLVIYVGGASGSGKSSLSLELAPLLRIYRINATDTIRQVMRMVFTPKIMPALHSSSFEIVEHLETPPSEEPAGAALDINHPDRVIASFEEQARGVCVGVRAVVERAIAENMSILVEGVHLVPGLVPFPDLEGMAYQVPLVLTTPDEEVHRTRFLARSRVSARRAERYLENFEDIRTIHNYVLQQATAHEVQELETSQGDPPVVPTLELVTGVLQHRLPSLSASSDTRLESPPTILLIIDGLTDRPVRELGNRTPLQAAETPVLDRLATEGLCGLADPVAPGVVPDTAAGSLALFGQSPLALKRGPVEALGAGFTLSAGDVALRGNFATIESNGTVIDRRAGRIRDEAEELAKAIDCVSLPKDVSSQVDVRVKVGTEHRLAVVLSGDGLSADINGSDPGEGTLPSKALTPRPLDPNNDRAIYTAQVLAMFEKAARDILLSHPINKALEKQRLRPANALLTRGAGRIHQLIPLEEAGLPLRLVCISGDRTLLGLASWLGANTVSTDKMTANLDTDLGAKFDAAGEALRHNDLVIVHVKGADIAAHDRRPDLKAEFLEKVDSELGRLIETQEGELRVAVTSDHATLSESGQHAADPLPVVIWGTGIEGDTVQRFDEQTVATGALERFPLQMLLSRLFDLS